MIIEAKDIKKVYYKNSLFLKGKGETALNSVTLSMKEGGAYGLVGESGSGKTTLAKIILNLEPPTEGKVLFKGRDIAGLKGAEFKEMRRNIQAVFQDPYQSLNPRQSVRAALSEPYDIYGMYTNNTEREGKLESLVKSVGLSADTLKKYPHEFSGGQRQRIAIARALALNPAVIIADEPTSALDVSVQAQILNLLKEVQSQYKLTTLLITHDLACARFLCSDIAVMREGGIVESGSSEEIFSNPKTPYTQALLKASPRFNKRENV
ncbi:peptide/nickel transport system ATP-binding protein/oligopeptide transport system ATP-binding protein [Parelusimicrobium proximum]|uniref:ATP-binding cassette domain-containing protein n=1 Tax=Parelusimicrobium proximum TaxID=3228953 RepID=UPI003D167E8A